MHMFQVCSVLGRWCSCMVILICVSTMLAGLLCIAWVYILFVSMWLVWCMGCLTYMLLIFGEHVRIFTFSSGLDLAPYNMSKHLQCMSSCCASWSHVYVRPKTMWHCAHESHDRLCNYHLKFTISRYFLGWVNQGIVKVVDLSLAYISNFKFRDSIKVNQYKIFLQLVQRLWWENLSNSLCMIRG